MADLPELIARAAYVEHERRRGTRADWAVVHPDNQRLMTETAQALLDAGVIAPGPLYAAADVLEDAEREGHYVCACGWEGAAGAADAHATSCVASRNGEAV